MSLPDRSASSYKEEIYRFLHDQPHGVLADDRVGIVRVIAEAFEYALPISVGTVGGALGTLEREARIVLERGHRSVGNKLLFTKATVCSEPLQGRAIGPSEPVERQPLRLVKDEPDVLERLRRLEDGLSDRPSPLRIDLEKVHEHVLCLVEEIDRLTGEVIDWEELAVEAEAGLSVALAEQRETLTGEFDVETESLRVQLADAQDALLVTSRSVNDRLNKSDHEHATVRERGEHYRLERDEAKTRAAQLEDEVFDLREGAKKSDAAIAGLQVRLANQHRQQLAANHERDEAVSARDKTRAIAISREKEILDDYASATHLIGETVSIMRCVERNEKVIRTSKYCEVLGLDSGSMDINQNVVKDAILELMVENNITNDRRVINGIPQNMPIWTKAAKADLAFRHGKI
jgi:predicted  nucleic acid-binding Zn-ribbon protein